MQKRDIEQSLESLLSSIDAMSEQVSQLADMGDWEIQKLATYQEDNSIVEITS